MNFVGFDLDSVSHNKLLGSLSDLSIKGKEINWFEHYLSNRHIEIESTVIDS